MTGQSMIDRLIASRGTRDSAVVLDEPAQALDLTLHGVVLNRLRARCRRA